MKITPKDYAISLLRAIEGKKENEAKVVIENFVGLLARNNDLSKAPGIMDIFSSLWNKENKIIESEITAAKKLDANSLDSLKGFLLKLSGAKEVKMIEKVDKDILGGIVVRYDDKVIDMSLRTKIRNLSNSIKT